MNRKQVRLVRTYVVIGKGVRFPYKQIQDVLVVTADQLGKALVTRSVQKSRSCGEIEPIEAFFLYCLLVGNAHNLQIEIPMRLGCKKPRGGKLVVCACLHAYCTVQLELLLTNPPLNCQIDCKSE